MAGLSIPLHGHGAVGKGMGRPYAPAKRDEDLTLETIVIERTVGQLIDDNLAKQRAFIDRHETIPTSFVNELRALLERIT